MTFSAASFTLIVRERTRASRSPSGPGVGRANVGFALSGPGGGGEAHARSTMILTNPGRPTSALPLSRKSSRVHEHDHQLVPSGPDVFKRRVQLAERLPNLCFKFMALLGPR